MVILIPSDRILNSVLMIIALLTKFAIGAIQSAKIHLVILKS